MKRVAVLRGGPSEEYGVSMLTGKAVLAALDRNEVSPRDIVITKAGDWLEDGRKRTPEQALMGVDVVFLALHGTYGEDGQIQRILERANIPFTGSPSLASAIAFNKELTKQTLRPHGIKTPRHRKVQKFEQDNLELEVSQIVSDLGTELFIKPLANGSSYGARKVTEAAELYGNLQELLELYDDLLVEEYIQGTEATIGVLSDYRGEQLYAMPAVEIIPPQESHFFDSQVKYDGTTVELVPGRFSADLKQEMSRVAKLAHAEIGCAQYSRSDFMVKDGEVYFLEINTLPGMTDESLFPKAADAVGLDFKQLVKHLIETAKV